MDSLENNASVTSTTTRNSSSSTTTTTTTTTTTPTPTGSAPYGDSRRLAKVQGDLADFLAQHMTIVQRLKRLKPKTNSQERLLKNYIRVSIFFI